MTFSDFMAAQIEAIEASGLDPEQWIELHAEQFRVEHPVIEGSAE